MQMWSTIPLFLKFIWNDSQVQEELDNRSFTLKFLTKHANTAMLFYRVHWCVYWSCGDASGVQLTKAGPLHPLLVWAYLVLQWWVGLRTVRERWHSLPSKGPTLLTTLIFLLLSPLTYTLVFSCLYPSSIPLHSSALVVGSCACTSFWL